MKSANRKMSSVLLPREPYIVLRTTTNACGVGMGGAWVGGLKRPKKAEERSWWGPLRVTLRLAAWSQGVRLRGHFRSHDGMIHVTPNQVLFSLEHVPSESAARWSGRFRPPDKSANDCGPAHGVG